jgi:hypothetical protein
MRNRQLSLRRHRNWALASCMGVGCGALMAFGGAGARPEEWSCGDHHLLFLNSPAAAVTQSLSGTVQGRSSYTLKALLDCCGAAWDGHSCHRHGGFRLGLWAVGAGVLVEAEFDGSAGGHGVRVACGEGLQGRAECSGRAHAWSQGPICAPFLVSATVSLGDLAQLAGLAGRRLAVRLAASGPGQAHAHWVEVWEAPAEGCWAGEVGDGEPHLPGIPRMLDGTRHSADH